MGDHYAIRQYVTEDPATGTGRVHLDLYEVVGPDGEPVGVPVVDEEGNPVMVGGEQMTEARPLKLRAARRLLSRKTREEHMDMTNKPATDQVEGFEGEGECPDDPIDWRKIGGGSFRMKSGRIIKPNEKFKARPSEIPMAFRDVVVPLEPLPQPPPLEVADAGYSLRSRGPGWYDIVDANGKVMNESALRRDDAEEQLAKLNKE